MIESISIIPILFGSSFWIIFKRSEAMANNPFDGVVSQTGLLFFTNPAASTYGAEPSSVLILCRTPGILSMMSSSK